MTYLIEFFGGVKIFIIYIVIINLIGLYAMWSDKQKAIKNRWRTAEITLLFICAVGGGIGTIFGMYFYRHKTHKLKFTIRNAINYYSRNYLFCFFES